MQRNTEHFILGNNSTQSLYHRAISRSPPRIAAIQPLEIDIYTVAIRQQLGDVRSQSFAPCSIRNMRRPHLVPVLTVGRDQTQTYLEAPVTIIHFPNLRQQFFPAPSVFPGVIRIIELPIRQQINSSVATAGKSEVARRSGGILCYLGTCPGISPNRYLVDVSFEILPDNGIGRSIHKCKIVFVGYRRNVIGISLTCSAIGKQPNTGYSPTGRRNDRHGNMFPTCGSERILKIIRITVDSYQQFLLRLIAQFYGKLIGFIALIKNRCPRSPFFNRNPSLDSSVIHCWKPAGILQNFFAHIHAGAFAIQMKNSVSPFIFGHIRSIGQHTLIIGVSHRHCSGIARHLCIEKYQIISHQMHIPIYLQTVTMTHERRITRYHSIFKVIVIDNGFTRHIRGFAMMCQFIIHNIFALVLVKLVIEQKIVIFRVEFVHRITEHQVLGFSSRHLRFPETEFVDTSFKVFSYDKWLRCLRNNCSTGIGNPLFLTISPHIDSIGKCRNGKLRPRTYRQIVRYDKFLCRCFINQLPRGSEP